MSETLEFTKSDALTMGVELELQIVDRRTGDLTRGASDLIHLIERKPYPGDIKPEITESMIEISTKVHTQFGPLRDELRAIRDTLVQAADRLDLAIAGGGAHPFQRWHERQIFDRPRFRHVAGLYGYLAKQFTVFGQHVHIGCASGDAAMPLLHSLARYVPHFIALAACSPYYQGVDTAFDCSRLNTVFAFPLSGRAPFVTDWAGFEAYFAKMKRLGVVESMKDFYWDIRPKPEYGTIEIRVFDTPLTVDRAAELAGYLQAVCAMLVDTGARPESEDIYLAYSYNRFQACRFGLEAQLIDVVSGASIPLHRDVLDTVERCRPYAERLKSSEALDAIEALVRAHGNQARWQRETYQQSRSLAEVVLRSASLWSRRSA
ncbi:MAG: YbdK family carboxylate-amine ligase [Burkholderiaceae bacterium]|nr:YbdK family carboxylate-amine ligase [Burkholderiaceae bacterium]GIL06331.1 MAG: putative glutamate--cysteine ligase 2 [Betaproteobacteria bacterium]